MKVTGARVFATSFQATNDDDDNSARDNKNKSISAIINK